MEVEGGAGIVDRGREHQPLNGVEVAQPRVVADQEVVTGEPAPVRPPVPPQARCRIGPAAEGLGRGVDEPFG
jgi:hypothetical protein